MDPDEGYAYGSDTELDQGENSEASNRCYEHLRTQNKQEEEGKAETIKITAEVASRMCCGLVQRGLRDNQVIYATRSCLNIEHLRYQSAVVNIQRARCVGDGRCCGHRDYRDCTIRQALKDGSLVLNKSKIQTLGTTAVNNQVQFWVLLSGQMNLRRSDLLKGRRPLYKVGDFVVIAGHANNGADRVPWFGRVITTDPAKQRLTLRWHEPNEDGVYVREVRDGEPLVDESVKYDQIITKVQLTDSMTLTEKEMTKARDAL
ncbi:hypothetical protein Bbelb_283330 [Branchiostoma belcheri]|nr:hypothetical protein Bbelb_283330 [Branchiostoma belcheri]